jgi:hypothetical protein
VKRTRLERKKSRGGLEISSCLQAENFGTGVDKGGASDSDLLCFFRSSGRLDELSMKFWVVACGANVPILGPLLNGTIFGALRLKLHLFGKLCSSMGRY